ncbi:MAG: ABC transporter ATP-binding protein [Lachnospiraceae bacterium]|nr:ABC transporter ATP-binding protein [Lachnospiraceae bacterium]
MSKQKKPSDFSRLMGYAGKRKILTYLSMILSALSSILSLAPFIFIFKIVKEIIKVRPDFSKADHIVHNGWLAVIFALCSMIVYVGALMCSHLAAFRVAGNIRFALLSHITKLPIGAVDAFGSGRIRKIVNDASSSTESYLAHMLPDTINGFVVPIAMIVMLFVYDWRFGLMSLLPIVLSFLTMGKMLGPQMVEDMKSYQNALEDMNNEAVEYVRGIPVVKTFGQTVHSFSRFKASINNYYNFCISYTKSMRTPMVLFTMFINSTFGFIAALALILTRSGNITQDIILNFVFYVIITPVITTAFQKIMFSSETQMKLADAFARFDMVFQLAPIDITGDKKPEDNSVELKNVTYRYDGAKTDAVSSISLKIKPNKKVAFVGPSGGGKTTIAALISRFFDVTDGEMLVGGINVKDMDKDVLMNTVSYVFQDNKLLKASIADNVRLARPDASDSEVKEALVAAQCEDILEKLPEGIHTVIGTKGVYLSGGEMQRIAIARAILKNAPIIVLDEATAFADPENETLVQKAFEELSKDKTVIMIAHRLTTVMNADRIFVVDSGKIVEEGTHDELISQGGLYSKMWSDYKQSVNWKVGA